MYKTQASEIKLSEKQKKILIQLQNGTHSPLHLKQRAKIILLASECNSNNEIERKMEIHGETVIKWRNRYSNEYEELSKIEIENPRKLKEIIKKILSDAQRSGAPPTFSDEQVACILALGCEKPEELGLPFSHWSPSLLREEVIKRGIVESISVTQISRFFKRKRFKAS